MGKKDKGSSDPSWYVPGGNGKYPWGSGPKPKKQGIISKLLGKKKGK